jgi:hypothetical protein
MRSRCNLVPNPVAPVSDRPIRAGAKARAIETVT